MVAWSGGDAAPADWDGGPVLSRGHGLRFPDNLNGGRWGRERTHPFFLENEESCDIIAYTPRATPPERSSEVVGDDRDRIADIIDANVSGPNLRALGIDPALHREDQLRAADAIIAALASRQPTPAPAADAEVRDGWKLVPVEPTEAMLDAAGYDFTAGQAEGVYRAMLSASPKAPAVAIGAGEVERLVAELRPLVDAAAGPNGWDWMFPLRVQPVDGKPTIVSHKGGNLFRGYIGTWQEADLLVALANAAPRILAALAPASASIPADVEREAGRRWVIAEARKALRLVEGCMECNADDERRWRETIEWLENLS